MQEQTTSFHPLHPSEMQCLQVFPDVRGHLLVEWKVLYFEHPQSLNTALRLFDPDLLLCFRTVPDAFEAVPTFEGRDPSKDAPL